MNRNLYFSVVAICLCPVDAFAIQRKPLKEAYFLCGYESNKALLSGPGRNNQIPLSQVMMWCMEKEGYTLDASKGVDFGGGVRVPCSNKENWSFVGNLGCYVKNDL